MRKTWGYGAFLLWLSFGVGAAEVALVTALSGNVTLLQEKAGAQALII